jgi:hypothetical protein
MCTASCPLVAGSCGRGADTPFGWMWTGTKSPWATVRVRGTTSLTDEGDDVLTLVQPATADDCL